MFQMKEQDKALEEEWSEVELCNLTQGSDHKDGQKDLWKNGCTEQEVSRYNKELETIKNDQI